MNLTRTLTATAIRPLLLASTMFGLLAAVETSSAAPLPYGPDTCVQGYVWRVAISSDHVCVTPGVRRQTAYDNSQAGYRTDPQGPYGSSTCVQGYVWRNAFDGDVVCVVPQVRDQAQRDNAFADVRRAH